MPGSDIKEHFVKKKLFILFISVLGLELYANQYVKKESKKSDVPTEGYEYHIEVGDNLGLLFWITPHGLTKNTPFIVAEICPVSDSLCKIRYDDGIVEYVKIGDVFQYGLGELVTVISFDYNEIVCDVSYPEKIEDDSAE